MIFLRITLLLVVGLLAVDAVEHGEAERGPDEQSPEPSELDALHDAEEDHEGGHSDQISDEHGLEGVCISIGVGMAWVHN